MMWWKRLFAAGQIEKTWPRYTLLCGSFFEFLKEVSCSARNISSRQFAGICEGNKFFISMIDSSPCCSFLLYRMSDSGYVLNFFSEICIRIRVLHDRANVFCIPIWIWKFPNPQTILTVDWSDWLLKGHSLSVPNVAGPFWIAGLGLTCIVLSFVALTKLEQFHCRYPTNNTPVERAQCLYWWEIEACLLSASGKQLQLSESSLRQFPVTSIEIHILQNMACTSLAFLPARIVHMTNHIWTVASII